VLSCIGGITVGPEPVEVGTPALAQATSGIPAPPADAPVMAPGQRVHRSFGWIEIMTFSRSDQNQYSIFSVEFRVRTEENSVAFDSSRMFRLVADGFPREPDSAGIFFIDIESAKESKVTFHVRGRPRVVYLQFGTGKSEHSFLRWPD
jgi:hypothetical protein